MNEHGRLDVEVVKAVRASATPASIRDVVRRAATLPELKARLPEGRAVVAYLLAGDDELRRLNQTFAADDAVTDVLAFAGSGTHLGDVAISWAAVQRQAVQYGHPESVELGLLCVHGLLHLLGWNHESTRGRTEMSRLTAAALALSGLRLASGRL
ncbi:MAG: rRNA maturation RNase YbeY [Candidatus Dormibacteraceae bacterium]